MSSIQARKGQSSVEFVSLAGVMFIILIGMLLVLQNRLSALQASKAYEASSRLASMIESEVRLAQATTGDYSRTFLLPHEFLGYNYSVELSEPTEIVISIEGNDYVVFLEHNISGSIGKGLNLITKQEGELSIASLGPAG